MVTKGNLRYACYRAKKGNITSDIMPLLESIEVKLEAHQRWENFSTEWDILVSDNNEIIIIKPETDYNFIHSTCLEANILSKREMSFSSFDERQRNIIKIIEASMLDELMSWETYNTSWGIEIDHTLKLIKTKLYNVESNQITVTEEMIEASKKEPTIVPLNAPDPLVLEPTPMSEEEIASLKKMLKEKNILTERRE